MPDPDLQRLLQNLVKAPDNPCFGCGPRNPSGLHLHVEEQDGVTFAAFTPGEWHQGWEGIIHGGILAALLDEVMAYCLYFVGVKGVTARMEIRFRAAVSKGDSLRIEAREARRAPRIVDIEGRILRDGKVVTEATGRFMKLGEFDPTTVRL